MYKLLSPSKIGSVEIKNRIILPSMCLYYSGNDGEITEKQMSFMEKRAQAGVGAFIIPANPHGKNKRARGSLNNDSRITEWKLLLDRLHKHGAKVFCQIHPAGIQFGRIGFEDNPLEMPTEDVDMLIESYAQGALRALKAGFDGVEIHGAHGHEIALFLSALINKRTDKYGFDIHGRTRIINDMIRRIKELTSPDFPVIIRISGEEKLPGGREIGESLEMCLLAQEAGADAIHVSVGMPDSEEWECPPCEIPQGHIAWMAEHLKRNLKIPVITVGRIVNWQVAEEIVAKEQADFIAMARALLAEPDWMASIGQDNLDRFRLCIGCNQGCRTKREQQKTFTTCLQNPLTGREDEINIQLDSVSRNICVIGAGVSGLEAANILARRGHKVTVYEKQGHLGGNFLWASKPPGKEGYLHLIKYYERTLTDLGVNFIFNYNVETVPEGNWDLVLVAVGAKEITPNINYNDAVIYTALDLFAAGEPKAERYVVIGDGLVGYETADYLLSYGKEVILVGNNPKDPIWDLGIARWRFMKERFEKGRIEILGNSTVTSISAKGFTVTGPTDEEQVLEGQYTYVLACGFKENDELYHKIKKQGHQVEIIGSAAICGDAMDAIHHGFATALKV